MGIVLEFILLSIIGGFYCVGVYVATRPGQILGWFGNVSRKQVEYIRKPITECLSCMSSFHGSYIYIIYWAANDCEIWMLPGYVLVLCGVNSLFGKYITS